MTFQKQVLRHVGGEIDWPSGRGTARRRLGRPIELDAGRRQFLRKIDANV